MIAEARSQSVRGSRARAPLRVPIVPAGEAADLGHHFCPFERLREGEDHDPRHAVVCRAVAADQGVARADIPVPKPDFRTGRVVEVAPFPLMLFAVV